MDHWFSSQGLDYDAVFNSTSSGGPQPDQAGPPVPHCAKGPKLTGNGNPHQNYYHTQVTQNFNCGNGGCSVTHENTKTIGWTATAGFSINGWISGSFAVMTSYTTGNSYTCDGTAADGEVCVWWNVAHTAYTVHEFTDCPGQKPTLGPNYVMYSPNDNNVGGSGYCVRGIKYCRNINASYWIHQGRAGGP